MAIDAVEDSSIPSLSRSPARSIPSQPRHFYVAVDRLQFKMDTLADLLRVAGQRPGVPMVVCCSSRDELDAVCCAVSNLPFISLAALYSDLAEAERALVLDGFRQSTLHWNQRVVVQSGNDVKAVEEVEQKSHIVVVTDACLPLLTSGELPLSARVLINYELPTKKETYMRRMAACLAAGYFRNYHLNESSCVAFL